MATYTITGMEDATITKDRSKFDIRFRTNKGKVTMSVSAAHLDALITMLQGLEYTASLLNPKTGQQPGEQAQIRAEIVDSYQVGNAALNDIPSVLLGLKSAQVFRWFALDEVKATEISQALVAKIPKLQSQPSRH